MYIVDKVINVQKKLNHYCMYIKQLILSYIDESDVSKIHVRRLTVILERLFVNEQSYFTDFFINDKRSKVAQFLDYLVRVGEIMHVGDGYYILPPERTVNFSNNRHLSVSNIQKVNASKFGLAIRVNESSKINLTLDEFLYRPTLDNLFDVYQSCLLAEHDVEPDSIIYFTENKVYKSESKNNVSENEFYILNFDRKLGTKIKPEKYFAQWKNNKWYVVQIKKEDYLRLFLALKTRKGFIDYYSISNFKNDICHLNLTTNLPKEELALLTLIATPTSNIKCKSFYFNKSDQSIIEDILKYCNLQNERKSKVGVYN